MTIWNRARGAMAAAAAVIAACGGGGGGPHGGDPGGASGTAVVTPSAGGSVSIPSGPTLVVPAGAVTSATEVAVAAAPSPAPNGTTLWKFSPDGTTFAKPVRVSLPVPAGQGAVAVYWSKPGSATEFESLGGSVEGGAITVAISHFSVGFVGPACSEGAACTPANACHVGAWSCSSGAPVCLDTAANQPDGSACGAGLLCASGACVGPRTVRGAFLERVFPVDGAAEPPPSPWPQPPDTSVAALVRDGSAAGYATYPGTVNADGSFAIPGVPPGRYLLAVAQGGAVTLTEVSGSSPTQTHYVAQRPGLARATADLPVKLDVSGLGAFTPGGFYRGDYFDIASAEAAVDLRPFQFGNATPAIAAGASRYLGTVSWVAGSGLPDAAKGDAVFLVHAPIETVGTGAVEAVLKRSTRYARLTDVTIAQRGGGALVGTLTTAASTATLGGNVKYTQWSVLRASANPGALDAGFAIDLFARPWPSVAYPLPDGPAVVLAVLGRTPAAVAAGSAPDTDYAGIAPSLAYGRFLDPVFKEVAQIWQGFDVERALPGVTSLFLPANVWKIAAPPAAGAPIVPDLGPPTAPLVDGLDAFVERTGVGTQPTLSWSAPTLGAPTSFVVRIQQLVAVAGATQLATTGELTATVRGTSFKIPAGVLGAGSRYVATITAIQAPWDVLDADLGLFGLPWSSADCVTATFSP